MLVRAHARIGGGLCCAGDLSKQGLSGTEVQQARVCLRGDLRGNEESAMFFELRQYRTKPGQREKWVKFIPTASFNSLPNVLVRKNVVTSRSWLT